MRVLITTDGSECSFEAARIFVRLTHATHNQITALYVLPLLTIGRATEYLQIEQEREGQTALNTVRSIFNEVALPIETELRQGIPMNTILEVARNGKYELIVMGHHGRGGFREYLLGSVSKSIVRNAPCAVLIGK